MVWCFWSIFIPSRSDFESAVTKSKDPCADSGDGVNFQYDSNSTTFYDDPDLSYNIEKPVKNWDEKRREWLKHHPSFAAGARERIVVLTGSQLKPCKNPIGDHFLLRLFKNKVDYCRIHGYDIFYNNQLLHPKMNSFWAKHPVVKAAMLAHPEAEWIWWVDSDAVFTDMDFKVQLGRYKNHNLVVNGWPHLIYDKRSWTSVNAGVFLIRNCQWSLDFLDVWAQMGPISPEFEKWGQIQKSTFPDKMFPASDDQTALIYMIYKHKEKYYDHVYFESHFQEYWVDVSGAYANITAKYLEVEKGAPKLRRRHAEKVSEQYAALMEGYLKGAGDGYAEEMSVQYAASRGKGEGIGKGSWRRPFMVHFTGCQPCSGDHNPMYGGDACWDGIREALNFADNQVLRKYGFVHSGLQDSSPLTEVSFDYPAS